MRNETARKIAFLMLAVLLIFLISWMIGSTDFFSTAVLAVIVGVFCWDIEEYFDILKKENHAKNSEPINENSNVQCGKITAYVLNLARAKERWEFILPQVKALGIPYEKITAIDGKKLSEKSKKDIVQAARVSYGVGTKRVQEDRGLINYLMRHGHTTPFEMCEIKLHVKLPIFVMRHWVRHRTANINEYSARYSVLSNEFYIPELEQIARQSETNKQGKSDVAMDTAKGQEVVDTLDDFSKSAYEKYSHMLDDLGLTRELARTILPVSVYTEMYWKIDLHNLLHFLKLRADSHAQYEIRCYANKILDIVKAWVPFTYDAFVNYRQNAVSVSKKCIELNKRMLKGEEITQENSGLSKGEWQEFLTAFDLRDLIP